MAAAPPRFDEPSASRPARVLAGRLTFTPNPDGSGYDFAGPTRFDRLFSGLVVASVPLPPWIELGDTTGHEGIGPEDTGEADYGRLLERVYGKGDSSPAGTADGWPVRVAGFSDLRAA